MGLNLSQDLLVIYQLNAQERELHLRTISTPLLHSLYSDLSNKRQLPWVDILCYLQWETTTVLSLLIINKMASLELKTSELVIDAFDEILELAMAESKSREFSTLIILKNLFPVLTEASSAIFLKNSKLAAFLSTQVTLSFNAANAHSIENTNKLLGLFSVACIDDQCKSIIASLYDKILSDVLDSNDSDLLFSCKKLAANISIKVWKIFSKEKIQSHPSMQLKSLFDILIKDSIDSDVTIEGLALLTTNLQIKQLLREKTSIINKLMAKLDAKDESLYGVMTIFENLTQPNIFSTLNSVNAMKDSYSISKVDIYSNGRNNSLKKDEDEQLGEFDAYLFKNNFITKVCNLLTSKTGISELTVMGIFKTLCYVSYMPAVSPAPPVQEVKKLIKYLLSYILSRSESGDFKYNSQSFTKITDSAKFSENHLQNRVFATRAISHLLITSNPQNYFDSYMDLISCIPILLEFVIENHCQIFKDCNKMTIYSKLQGFKPSNLDLFDSTAAICNLTAIENINGENCNSQSTQLLFSLGFDAIFHLIENSDLQIVKVALNCLSNIISIPLCCAKFFNWQSANDPYYFNFIKLSNLLQSEGEILTGALECFVRVCPFSVVSYKLAQDSKFRGLMIQLAAECKDEEQRDQIAYIIDCMTAVSDKEPFKVDLLNTLSMLDQQEQIEELGNNLEKSL